MSKKDNITELIDFIKKYENKGIFYDAIIPYTGGKDSTYVLHFIKENTKLRVLAFTFDNYYTSKDAEDNINRITRKIGVDHLILKPDWKIIKELYKKSLFEYGEFCKVCEGLFAAALYKLSIEMKIPLIIWALSKSQFKTPPDIIRETDKSILLKNFNRFVSPLYDLELSKKQKYYIDTFNYTAALNSSILYPVEIFPLLAMDYNPEEIKNKIEKDLGWKRPTDIKGRSTNCRAVNLFNYLKIRTLGKDKFIEILDNMIAEKQISVNEKNNILSVESNTNEISQILDELEIDVNYLLSKIKNITKYIR